MSRYALSDIHGCAETFKATLDRIGLTPEDELYLLGDFIDRGPDSGGVIDQVLQLIEHGYRVVCIRGNHEQMYLDMYREATRGVRLRGFPEETVRSFGVDDIRDTPARYLHFMLQLPNYHLLPDYVLVHAGLDFRLPDPLQNEEAMLWRRYWYDQINRSWLGDRIIVHGHTPTPTGVIRRSLQELEDCPAIGIDAGCIYHSSGLGYLCLFDLDERSLYFQRRIDTLP